MSDYQYNYDADFFTDDDYLEKDKEEWFATLPQPYYEAVRDLEDHDVKMDEWEAFITFPEAVKNNRFYEEYVQLTDREKDIVRRDLATVDAYEGWYQELLDIAKRLKRLGG